MKKLVNQYKIFIIPNKNIYLSDNIDNTSNIINLTSTSALASKNYLLTMDNCKQFNILNNDSTNLYLQNTIDSIQNIIFNINQDSNQNYISINKLNNTSNVYVSNGSNYDYV